MHGVGRVSNAAGDCRLIDSEGLRRRILVLFMKYSFRIAACAMAQKLIFGVQIPQLSSAD